MADLIDGTLDELDTHLRQLRREVSRLEALRRQLEEPLESPGSNVPRGAVGGDALDSGPRARTRADR
jgi:hypothetical protein